MSQSPDKAIDQMTVLELRRVARDKGIRLSAGISKQGILQAIYDSMDVLPVSAVPPMAVGAAKPQAETSRDNDNISAVSEPIADAAPVLTPLHTAASADADISAAPPVRKTRKPAARKAAESAKASAANEDGAPQAAVSEQASDKPDNQSPADSQAVAPADADTKPAESQAKESPASTAEEKIIRHAVMIADDEEDDYDLIDTPTISPALRKPVTSRPIIAQPAPDSVPPTPAIPAPQTDTSPTKPAYDAREAAPRTAPAPARPAPKSPPSFSMEGVRAWHNPHAQPYQKGGYGTQPRTAPTWQTRAPLPSQPRNNPMPNTRPVDRAPSPAMNMRPATSYAPRFGPDADGRGSNGDGYARREPAYRMQDDTGYRMQDNGYRDTAPRDNYRNSEPVYRDGYRNTENTYNAPYYRQQDNVQDGYRQSAPSYADAPQNMPMGIPEMLATGECADVNGILEIHADGYGFLRQQNYTQSKNDVYISNAQIRRFQLRTGDYVEGKARPQREGERYFAMLYITAVNDEAADDIKPRPNFEDLTPIYPDRRIQLESEESADLSIRMMDLVAPLGFGQRAMIVAPPKAGKTTILKKLAAAIESNYPDVHLIMLLVDERPEEVTDFKECIKGEVLYSTFDEPPENHIHVAELVLERAERLVESKKDVVILMDSLTRLSRAYNACAPQTSRAMSGGLAAGVLQKPKRFFGAARNLREGGSLTVIATALVETGSRMDDIIFEEFKGTGNMELHLDRRLSEKRVFPAVSLAKSGTRREELLLTEKELAGARDIRAVLSSSNEADATSQLIEMMDRAKTNEQLIDRLKDWITMMSRAGFALNKS